jgi:type IV pilus assembly protein PilC
MSSTQRHLFIYSGNNSQGQPVRGQLRAQNSEWARHKLRRQGIKVRSIRRSRHYLFTVGGNCSTSDIVFFTRQLSMLVKVGIPLSRSFDILSASTQKTAMQMLIAELKEDIGTGESFARALRKHPHQFDSLFCNMVESGELSSRLPTVLERLANYQEQLEKLRKTIKKALAYPCIVTLVALLVTAVLLIKVIPEFAQTFSELGTELPALTLFVLNLSHQVQQLWLSMVLGICIFCGVFAMALKRSTWFSYTLDSMLLQVPGIGKLFKLAILARFSRTLATTFNAGVPILDALQSAASTAGNALYVEGILTLRQDLIQGISLKRAVHRQSIFPLALQQMIIVGEESGTLGQILDRAGAIYEQDMQLLVDTLTQLTEPLVMLVLGLLVGVLLLAMYMPIFELGSIL